MKGIHEDTIFYFSYFNRSNRLLKIILRLYFVILAYGKVKLKTEILQRMERGIGDTLL